MNDNDEISDDDFTNLLWDHLRGTAGLQKFPLGRVVITPAAKNLLDEKQLHAIEFLDRHSRGDWGDISEADWEENDWSVDEGLRILSVYRIGEDKIYIITESDRSSTTILTPDDY